MSTTPQEYFTALTEQTQQAGQAAMDAWINAVQSSAIRMPTVVNRAAAHAFIDQVCNFAISVIDVQRTFAKQLADAATSAAETAREKSEEVVTSQPQPQPQPQPTPDGAWPH